MKYMGSKNRIAKYLLPIILADRQKGQWYVEPFVGGANMIDKVDGNRLGADSNEYLIAALKLIRDCPESIPDIITEDMYQQMKNQRVVDGLTGFTSFALSFGGKFFGGYRRDVAGTKGSIYNMKTQTRRAKNAALVQSPLLQGVTLVCSKYLDLEIPPNSIVYCDPPYAGTTKYKDGFNHKEFWSWAEELAQKGHKVFVSEYRAPESWTCVWSKEQTSSLTQDTGSKRAVERLFTL
jgi:DNA adenine methylase